MFALGVIYYEAQNVAQDISKSKYWLKQAASKGFKDANDLLEKIKAAEKQSHTSAQIDGVKNKAEALFERAENYRIVKKNFNKAFESYKKAAELGHAEAMYNLAAAYKYVKHNSTKAIEWHEKAAKLGYAKSMFILGAMYEYGQGVKKNLTTAIEWYEKAADEFNFEAMNKLGEIYALQGNLEKAREWYERAADGGNDDAIFALAMINAVDVDKDKHDKKISLNTF